MSLDILCELTFRDAYHHHRQWRGLIYGGPLFIGLASIYCLFITNANLYYQRPFKFKCTPFNQFSFYLSRSMHTNGDNIYLRRMKVIEFSFNNSSMFLFSKVSHKIFKFEIKTFKILFSPSLGILIYFTCVRNKIARTHLMALSSLHS